MGRGVRSREVEALRATSLVVARFVIKKEGRPLLAAGILIVVMVLCQKKEGVNPSFFI